MALRPTDAHLAVITAGTAHTFTRISIGEGHRTPDGTETALVTPFSPARSNNNPPGVIDAATRAVDWVDGSTGDSVAYIVSEAGLWATPAGGSEYLALYDSHATDDIFTKPAGSIISHRFLIMLSFVQMVNATFTVSAVPQATETVAGVIEIASNAEADAAEASAANDRAVSVAKWWRLFTTARVIGRIAAATGVNRLSYDSLKDTPAAVDLSDYALLDDPDLTGTPTAPTPPAGNNSTRIATTAFVNNYTASVTRHTTQSSYDASLAANEAGLHVLAIP